MSSVNTLQMWTSHMANMTEHDPTRDERFEVAALGVPGALPIGDRRARRRGRQSPVA